MRGCVGGLVCVRVVYVLGCDGCVCCVVVLFCGDRTCVCALGAALCDASVVDVTVLVLLWMSLSKCASNADGDD